MAIYETRGLAREYSELACNLYNGCSHGCVYCYAPRVLRMERDQFLEPAPRLGILERLEEDARRLERRGECRSVLLCFTCDPYQPDEAKHQLTRGAIELLHAHGLGVNILTKAGALPLRDLELFGPRDSFGVTLTTTSDAESRTWEPGAASPAERILLLRRFHDAGVRTWASLEPVIYPQQTLELICATAAYVDEYKIGKLNYHPHTFFHTDRVLARFVQDVIDVCEHIGVRYTLKESLAAYLPERVVNR